MAFFLPLFLAAGSAGLSFAQSRGQNRAVAASTTAQLRQSKLAEADEQRRRAAEFFRDRGSVDAVVGSAGVEGQGVVDVMMRLIADATDDKNAIEQGAKSTREHLTAAAEGRMTSPLISGLTGALQGFSMGLSLQQGINALKAPPAPEGSG